jgi:hypothetical protein
LSTETTRDGDEVFVRAETTHFSPNVVIEVSEVWGINPRVQLIPAFFTVPIDSKNDTSWALESVTDMVPAGDSVVPIRTPGDLPTR